MRCRHTCFLYIAFLLICIAQCHSQSPDSEPHPVSRGIGYIFNYLNMADTKNASQFIPLTQGERTRIYWKTMVNPLGYMKAATSAGIDQWSHKPEEWEQGAS